MSESARLNRHGGPRTVRLKSPAVALQDAAKGALPKAFEVPTAIVALPNAMTGASVAGGRDSNDDRDQM